MLIRSAEYLKSSAKFEQCPEPAYPEYAFIGRSNVGKSSLINMLTERKALAKTSGTPGKTQLISHFIINDSWYLVDLPGYGYAKRSKKARGQWEIMIRTYLRGRPSLMQTFILVDSRLDPQQNDLEFMDWLSENEISFVMLFTKADKLSRNQLSLQLKKYKEELSKYWDELPPAIITSAQTQMGREEVLGLIDHLNADFPTDWKGIEKPI